MFAYIHIRVYARKCLYVCMCMFVCVFVCVQVFVCLSVWLIVYGSMCVSGCVCLNLCMNISVCVCKSEWGCLRLHVRMNSWIRTYKNFFFWIQTKMMRKYYNDGEAIIRHAGVLLSNNCSHSGQHTRTRTHRHTDTHKIDYIRRDKKNK